MPGSLPAELESTEPIPPIPDVPVGLPSTCPPAGHPPLRASCRGDRSHGEATADLFPRRSPAPSACQHADRQPSQRRQPIWSIGPAALADL
jgi:hypothetical protein